MEDILNALRAKSKEEENYLLKDHIKETILRAIQLREFINKNKDTIKYKFNDEFFEDLVITCFLHDLGKINWEFQKGLYRKDEEKSNEFKQVNEFFKGYTDIKVKDHEVLSVINSHIFLENSERDDRNKKIRTAILLHHYNQFYTNREINIAKILEDYPDIEKYLEFLIKKKEIIKEHVIEKLLQTLLDEIGDAFAKRILSNLLQKGNFDRLQELHKSIQRGVDITKHIHMFQPPDKVDESLYDFLVFLGCLRRCDYSSSGNFDIENITNLRDIFGIVDKEITRNMDEKGWKCWQENVLKEIGESSAVLIAPTGSGKTEFALMWGSRIGYKFIYTVPLRVALNDLYKRFKDYLGENYFRHLGLLHSTAFVEFVKEKRENKKDIDIENKVNSVSLLASPLTLATPDQVFLTSLHYYGSDKVISVYPYSAFVLDEVQSYTPEMAAIIIKTLKIIEKLGGKSLVMTATLPPYYMPFFEACQIELIPKHEKILARFKINAKKFDTEKIKEEVKNYKIVRHKIKIVKENLVTYMNSEGESKLENIKVNDTLDEKISELKRSGKKSILIVVNNVTKAIKIYDCLKEKPRYLLHSRLLEKEKEERIKEIEKKLKDKEEVLVVATQLVEASVNLDFDGMITEISPIDSQIQRWGRVYRNRNEDYSGEPNIYVFVGEKEGEFDKGTRAIYGNTKSGKVVLEKTVEALKKIDGSSLNYEKERKLIENVFNEKDNETGKEVWKLYFEEILENLEFLDYFAVEKKSQAQELFRKIAGFQVLVPELMENDPEEWVKRLPEIIKEETKPTWEDLENKLGKTKWEIKEVLYRYSINFPEFYLYGKERISGSFTEFKGFPVLWLEKKEDLDKLREYGLDKLAKKVEEDLLIT